MTLAGDVLVHDFAIKYLGVTLDRSLTYKKHTENVRDKVKSRCNIISKLAGTDWGALRPTNINWLPVLSNIEPPQIRRDRATLQEYKKEDE